MNQYSPLFPPIQIVAGNIAAANTKTQTSMLRIILLGIFAGMFIACGASASSVAMHAVANVGLARLVAGCVFPVGLMMIVFVGGELFTGDCLMIMGCMHKEFSVWKMIKVLIVVWISNLIGSVLFAAMVNASTQYNFTSGLLGAFTIKVAMGKLGMSFSSAFISGILCNFFVCIAVLMAAAAKDIAGKVWAIFFPIMAFVVSGYEHCVANMYYIPAGIFAAGNEAYVQKAMETYGYTAAQLEGLNWANMLVANLLPVTLGNIVGGMVLVGLPLYLIHGAKIRQEY
jgi:formate/nitrite transporter